MIRIKLNLATCKIKVNMFWKDFTIPLVVVIPARKVFENNKNGILGGLLNSFLKKSIKVQFKGDIKYKVFGYSSVYPVDQIQEIKF